MTDKNGNPIDLGDTVLFMAGSGHIHCGVITRMAGQNITVTYTIRTADGEVMSKDQITGPDNLVLVR